MRWAELGLFLSPFALYAAWHVASTRAQPAVLWSVAVLVACLAAGTLWFGLTRRLPPGATYVPAHIEDGRIVPGHGVPAPAR